MKNTIYTIKTYVLLLFLLVTTFGYSQHTAIVLDTTTIVGKCKLSGYDVKISVPKEALTWDEIALNINLPGRYDPNCVKKVSIRISENLRFVRSPQLIPFVRVGLDGDIFENSTILNGFDGHDFDVYFRFPSHVTCNGVEGTFEVTVTLDCDGVITTCITTVNVIARAANYWTISKDFITGNLACGLSTWGIGLSHPHNNPNGNMLGTYEITGTVTDVADFPIIGNSIMTYTRFRSSHTFRVTLLNCAQVDSIITNRAEYNFTLGNDCEEMVGSLIDHSPPLAGPEPDISFIKYADDLDNNFTPGCRGKYIIQVKNEGNVPWTNLEIIDDLNIPGITITHIVNSGGWIVDPPFFPPSNVLYSFKSPPGFVLNPSDFPVIFEIYFTVDSDTAVDTRIINRAILKYQAAGDGGETANTGGGDPTPCPGIECPSIVSDTLNTEAEVDFIVRSPALRVSLKKCILNPPNTGTPIYSIGDVIEFSALIGYSGAVNFSTELTDLLGPPNQNLQIIPNSISYEYYENRSSSNSNQCFLNNPDLLPFLVTVDTLDLQRPRWSINNMPPSTICGLSNFLMIRFNAKILPQIQGLKTNSARITRNSSSNLTSNASYIIDAAGILGILKEADAEFVENGDAFNYVITVSNLGSIPLNNIVVTDMLPGCVSLGQITIQDSFEIPIPNFTTTGNLTITIDPTIEIFPGNDFTITIPVVKSGSGICCNESVSVMAKLKTSGNDINANYGSVPAPAACVTDTKCCDIDSFEAAIEENNGSFTVSLNGGSVPLQEVEISMVDYHISYSEDACKPIDLGIFGTLTTSTPNLNSLILNSGDNGTSSLSWLLGNPSVVNSSVNLNILYPDVLNLECCDVDFYFCLKVKVKDVNCAECEQIICFSSEEKPEPCEINIKSLKGSYCVGNTINLNWSGSTPSGRVNIYLYDHTRGVNSVLAMGVPNTGTYNYNIPNTVKCDPFKWWSIIVEDAEKNCVSNTNKFRIQCCQNNLCVCGNWSTNSVNIKEYDNVIPIDAKAKISFPPNMERNVICGGNIILSNRMNYRFTSPIYVCNPTSCQPDYRWSIKDPDGVYEDGPGSSFNYAFSRAGFYTVVFTPDCGGNKCKDPCVINIQVLDRMDPGPRPGMMILDQN